MKMKKLLSGLLTGTMVLSMANVAWADDEINFTFDTGKQFFDSRIINNEEFVSPGTYSHSKEYDHTKNEGGSLKCELKGSTAPKLNHINIFEWNKLDAGAVYKVTAQVYGETVNTGAKVQFKGTNRNGYSAKCAGDSVNIVKDQWTEVSAYIYGQTIDWFGLTFTGGTTNSDKEATTGYDVYYVDDLKFKKVTDNSELQTVLAKFSPNFDLSKTLKSAPQEFDLTGTNTILAEGESSELQAYTISGEAGKTWNDVVSTKLKATEFTATSSDSDVAVFNASTGKIEAKSAGTATLTFKYGDITKSLPVTVYQQGNTVTDYFTKTGTSNIQIADLTDSQKKAAVVYDGSFYTGLATLKPHIISFRFFVPGTESSGGIKLSGWYGNGLDLQINYENNAQQITFAGGTVNGVKFNTGWNKLDFVVNYPQNHNRTEFEQDGEKWGYMSGSCYLNGSQIISPRDKAFRKSTVSLRSLSNFMVSDLRAVNLEKTFKIKSLSPAKNETISTLDDIDVELNGEIGTIEDGAVTVTDSDNNPIEAKILKASKTMLSVKPIGGLKANSNYTVKIDSTKITDVSGEALAAGAEYTFITNAVNVSDVIGSGYALVNSQYDMIGSGNLTLNDGAEITADNEVKAKSVSGQKELFKFNADESFTGDDAADRYVITYDMKTVATRSDELNSAGNPKYPPQDYEAVNIGSIKTDSTTGTVAQIGYCYGYGGAIGGKVGLGFYSKQSDNDLVKDKYGFTSNDMFWQGNGNEIYKQAIAKNVLENTGYYHVEAIIDNKAEEGYGDVMVTLNITDSEGTTYTYGSVPVKSADFKTIGNLAVKSKDDTAITKDIYMKNVNIYALKAQAVQADDFEISGIDVTTADDDATQLTSNSQLNGKKIAISYILKNNGLAAEQSYAVTAAVYEKDTNKLVAADVESGSVTFGEQTGVLTNELDLTGTSADKSYELRIFVWDSYKTLKPIISDVILPLN